jgi:UDP-glucose 4-epimerase
VRRVLVTGGAGFVGSHVVEALVGEGCDVLVVDNLTSGSRDNLLEGSDFRLMDIVDATAMAEAVRIYAPDSIVHLAALTEVAASVAQPARDAAVNVMGTLSVLNAAVAGRCRKVIFASSSTVYGEPLRQPVKEDDALRPLSPYGASKLAGEHYVRIICGLHGIAYTILRLGNVVGPRDALRNHHVVTAFVHALRSGQPPVIEWDGEQRKDYVFAGDVAAAVRLALDHGDSDAVNVASGVGTSVNEIFELVSRVLDLHVAPQYSARRPGDVRTFVMDCSRAERLLGWLPRTSIADQVTRTVQSIPLATSRRPTFSPAPLKTR